MGGMEKRGREIGGIGENLDFLHINDFNVTAWCNCLHFLRGACVLVYLRILV